MLVRAPADSRLEAKDYLQDWGASLFPSWFEGALHPFFRSLLYLDPDARVSAVQVCSIPSGVEGPAGLKSSRSAISKAYCQETSSGSQH